MDQEVKEYLDRKLILLATKDDIEKIRQEANANFRKLKEENKSQVAEWTQEIKSDLERLKKKKDTQNPKNNRCKGKKSGNMDTSRN